MRSRQVSRRWFVRQGSASWVTVCAGPTLCRRAGAAERPITDANAMAFLRDIAATTIESARVRPGQKRGGQGPNTTGITLITPGGNYPALWVRDLAMSLECGLIGPDEILPQLRLIARCQNGAEERRLKSGAIVPPFSIPDHISLAGGAVFYPGTYSSGEDQGADPWGPLPPVDDHYYFIHIAWSLWRATRDGAFLPESINDMPLFDRLRQAFAAPRVDPATGAVIATSTRRAVGFGFQDTVHLLGSMSFATLLRWQAANELAELCTAARAPELSEQYRVTAKQIATHLVPVFCNLGAFGGWLGAATEVSKEPDVWATLYALHLGVLPADAARRARQTVVDAVKGDKAHNIEYQGAVRHVPVDRDFSQKTAWERCVASHNTYQNGAYWHVPTGWLIQALHAVDPELSQQVLGRFIQHLRDNDFRKGGGRGAPWECFGLDSKGAQNPVYMASVAVPLGVLQRINRP